MALSELPPPERTSHPFFMHDMIRGAGAGFRATLDSLHEVDDDALHKGASRILFTGNGTAYFASLMGSQVLSGTPLAWSSAQAFEVANYPGIVAKDSLVVGVSHSGITKGTVDALAASKKAGASTLGVTHFRGRPISAVADKTLVVGDSPDVSRCHTKAYIDSAAACAEVAFRFAETSRLGGAGGVKSAFRELGGKIDEAIATTEGTARTTGALPVKKVSFAGAGPNAVTAREAALKVKESSYVPAEGLGLEEALHGPWVTFDADTLVVVIAPSGSTEARAADLLGVCRRVGATTAVVTDGSLKGDYTLKVPRTEEVLSPFLTILPLYFMAYYMAVDRGNNPDYLRYLDPRYWGARQIAFPPGTH